MSTNTFQELLVTFHRPGRSFFMAPYKMLNTELETIMSPTDLCRYRLDEHSSTFYIH